MNPIIAATLTALGTVTVIAAAAVLVVWLAMRGTDSRHRAAVIDSVAGLLRAIRGRR
ncbi:hypothetical protein [Saccharothrix sp. ST-888]|uniref:hypothetical protein n=1 Tax=Saccharothrix sp. ST-888 TaxID=1427391 RepID=UPI000A4BEB7E|nr:hypothetical protein [Saccharothrix sp. ST-888]